MCVEEYEEEGVDGKVRCGVEEKEGLDGKVRCALSSTRRKA